MSYLTSYALIFLVVFLANTASSLTGFGGTILALPIVAMIIGLKVAVPVLVIQAWVLAVFIVSEARRHISWRDWAKIVIFVVIGLPVGILLADTVPENPLKVALGLFTLGVGAYGVVRPMPGADSRERLVGWKGRALTALLAVGGVVHGAFATGGPLIVIYGTRALRDKSVFRVTMSMTWLTLNTILLAQWLVRGALTAPQLRLAAMCIPFTLAGMALGTFAHYRVSGDGAGDLRALPRERGGLPPRGLRGTHGRGGDAAGVGVGIDPGRPTRPSAAADRCPPRTARSRRRGGPWPRPR